MITAKTKHDETKIPMTMELVKSDIACEMKPEKRMSVVRIIDFPVVLNVLPIASFMSNPLRSSIFK